MARPFLCEIMNRRGFRRFMLVKTKTWFKLTSSASLPAATLAPYRHLNFPERMLWREPLPESDQAPRRAPNSIRALTATIARFVVISM